MVNVLKLKKWRDEGNTVQKQGALVRHVSTDGEIQQIKGKWQMCQRKWAEK